MHRPVGVWILIAVLLVLAAREADDAEVVVFRPPGIAAVDQQPSPFAYIREDGSQLYVPATGTDPVPPDLSLEDPFWPVPAVYLPEFEPDIGRITYQ